MSFSFNFTLMYLGIRANIQQLFSLTILNQKHFKISLFLHKKMFNKKIKILIAFFGLIYSIYQFYENYVGNGIFLILISLFFILIYFKNEIIFLAFLKLRKQDFQATERLLSKIYDPEKALVKKQQGYYNYLNGIIYSQKNLTQAEKYFKRAIQLGMSMNHDIAMAKMSLAGILMQKRRKREAQQLLTEAKKLDKHNMLNEQIKMIQQQMKRI